VRVINIESGQFNVGTKGIVAETLKYCVRQNNDIQKQ
jgi:hypothetical protein